MSTLCSEIHGNTNNEQHAIPTGGKCREVLANSAALTKMARSVI